ncbi:MAG: alpha/beta hydrolase [Alphaproteobacteria bacterium]|nr:alpha/beta hydrolase [Alphaproteobacteria bacterium]
MAVEFLTLADCSLAYQRQVGDADRPGIVFLSGYASDMEGHKAQYLAERCAGAHISFMRFDYRGCGLSPGVFTDSTIGAWLQDSFAILDILTKGPQIVVGSSMGGWLGLILASARPERVKAFVGIAAAPDFTEELVWEKLTDAGRKVLLREGRIFDGENPSHERAPITLRLIEEARTHLILRTPFTLPCPARLLQGKKDGEVPYAYAQRIADHIGGDARVTLVEDGDHRLSTPENLELLWQTVGEFL